MAAFHLGTQRKGFTWFWDDPAYVRHAQNLVAGRDYADFAYIPNPMNYIGPRTYPPGTAILIAPAVALFGVDTGALRKVGLTLHLLTLVALAVLVRKDLPLFHRGVLVAAVGVHPMFWDYLHRVNSDIPFVCLTFVALAMYGGLHGEDGTRRKGWPAALLTGAVTWFDVITRPIALTLLPAFLGYELARFRRVTRTFLVVALACGTLWGGQKLVAGVVSAQRQAAAAATTPAEGGAQAAGDEAVKARHGYAYLAAFNIAAKVERIPARIVRNAGKYAKAVDGLWGNLRSEPMQHGLFFLFAAPAAAGFVRRVRRRRSPAEAFTVVYFLSLLPWSWAGPRLLFPLIPMYYVYLLEGARWIEERVGAKVPVAAVLVAVAIAGTFASKYSRTDLGPMVDDYSVPDAQELYGFLDDSTDAGDIFVAEFPRQLAFFSGHRFTPPPHPRFPDELWWRFIERVGARYVVVGPCVQKPARPLDLVVGVDEFVKRWPDRFEQVFGNRRYRVYRILEGSGDPEGDRQAAGDPAGEGG